MLQLAVQELQAKVMLEVVQMLQVHNLLAVVAVPVAVVEVVVTVPLEMVDQEQHRLLLALA
jgi:uncharacterized membrane protein YozB (DUF420 family)